MLVAQSLCWNDPNSNQSSEGVLTSTPVEITIPYFRFLMHAILKGWPQTWFYSSIIKLASFLNCCIFSCISFLTIAFWFWPSGRANASLWQNVFGPLAPVVKLFTQGTQTRSLSIASFYTISQKTVLGVNLLQIMKSFGYRRKLWPGNPAL